MHLWKNQEESQNLEEMENWHLVCIWELLRNTENEGKLILMLSFSVITAFCLTLWGGGKSRTVYVADTVFLAFLCYLVHWQDPVWGICLDTTVHIFNVCDTHPPVTVCRLWKMISTKQLNLCPRHNYKSWCLQTANWSCNITLNQWAWVQRMSYLSHQHSLEESLPNTTWFTTQAKSPLPGGKKNQHVVSLIFI